MTIPSGVAPALGVTEGPSPVPAVPPAVLAVRYWRLACALSATHMLGTTWPPPGEQQRTRIVGHWGCNPGIAWCTAHLASHWTQGEPFLLVVGTGHAASFLFAHEAIATRAGAGAISTAAARYGQPGGTPSELIGLPGVPYSGGELGHALAVSQGLAAAGAASLTVSIVGDGECETPAALAGLAHADVMIGRCGSRWLPVINANGARMGGAARFSPTGLARLLGGLGYDVVCSGEAAGEASDAAAAALVACLAGRRSVWISVTEKGWPAPKFVDGQRYRGPAAHKAPITMRPDGISPAKEPEMLAWLGRTDLHGIIDVNAAAEADVAGLARRVTLSLERLDERPEVRSAPVGQGVKPVGDTAPEGWPPARAASQAYDRTSWHAPVRAADGVLAKSGAIVLSPDEAASNGLRQSVARGSVLEVLAEETCVAWAWGSVEAGQPAVFATYEAFAPLASSILAQYAKLTLARPTRPIPPLVVLSSSLGWANAPTHQNTDLTGALLARAPHASVVYPVGATSVGRRLGAALARRRDGVVMLSCSKQRLLDLPDPGGTVVGYSITGAPAPAATLIAAGDVCVTESIAAAALAAAVGIGLRVLAVIDLSSAGAVLRSVASGLLGHPVLGATSTAAHHVTPVFWAPLNRTFPVHGYAERFGPTPWETLRANRLDRVSLLSGLHEIGLDLPPGLLARTAKELTAQFRQAENLSGVLPFDCPSIVVDALMEDI